MYKYEPNQGSNVELEVYMEYRKTLPIAFNVPLVECGIPSKYVSVASMKDAFFDFISTRTFLEPREINQLINLAPPQVNTNVLVCDCVVKDSKNEAARVVEFNAAQHYGDGTVSSSFAELLAWDFVKETEIRRANLGFMAFNADKFNSRYTPFSVKSKLWAELQDFLQGPRFSIRQKQEQEDLRVTCRA